MIECLAEQLRELQYQGVQAMSTLLFYIGDNRRLRTKEYLHWNSNTHPRIALDYLYSPLDQGGLNLLDISAQNEAIELIWLREYLNLTKTRRTGAIVTDIMINATAPPGSSAIAITNSFLQSWNRHAKGPRQETLNNGIIRMLKTERKRKTNSQQQGSRQA